MAGYTRNDTGNNIADGNVINASDLDGEFDAVEAAFNNSTGHTHDGTSAEGAPIEVAGPAQDLVITATEVRPKTDNTLDLGTTTLEFKDAFFDGTVKTDTLTVDENATVTGNLTVNGNTTLGNAATDTVTVTADVASDLIPSADGTYDLGASGSEWQDLYIDGTANIDSLVADTADINGGTIDSTTIGGSTPAAGSFTTITGSGDMNIDSGTLFVDASENRVGIGTSSPSANLHIASGGSPENLELKFDTGSGATSSNFVDFNHSRTSGNFTFSFAGTERMRIDSDGDVFVGKTITAGATAGVVLQKSGRVAITRDDDLPLQVRRETSEGDLVEFRSDTTVVGSIGVASSRLQIGTDSDSAIFFDSTNTCVTPSDLNGSSDDVLDLGKSVARWKDLYLSGGVYLGGTTSANFLDDYEEGTFTPSAQYVSSNPTAGATTGEGRYTKIGNICHAFIALVNINATGASGDLRIYGLPFDSDTDSSIVSFVNAGIFANNLNVASSCYHLSPEVVDGQDYVQIRELLDNALADTINDVNVDDGVTDIRIGITYKTA